MSREEKTARVRRTFTPQFKKGMRSAWSTADIASLRSLGISDRAQPASAVERPRGPGRGGGFCARPARAPTPRMCVGAAPRKLRDVTEERDILGSTGVLRGRPEVKFPLRRRVQRASSASAACVGSSALSRSGYYAWCGRPLPRREFRNEALLAQIRETFRRSRGTYGSPRIHRALRKDGVSCGRHRIACSMQLGGIVAKMEAHFRWTSTKRDDIPTQRPTSCSWKCHADQPNRCGPPTLRAASHSGPARGWLHPRRHLGPLLATRGRPGR